MLNGQIEVNGKRLDETDLAAMPLEDFDAFVQGLYEAVEANFGDEEAWALPWDERFGADFADAFNTKSNERAQARQAAREAEEMAAPIIIDGVSYKKIKTFDVLWSGWECDSIAWIVEDATGKRFVIMTNHGSPQLSTVAALQERIETYQQVINDTTAAIALLDAK